MGFATQADLAAELGVDRTRISRWESGAEMPEGTNKTALMQTLKVSESFFDYPESAPPSPSFEAAAEFLSKYSGLSDLRKAIILMLVYDDPAYLDAFPELVPVLGSIAKA